MMATDYGMRKTSSFDSANSNIRNIDTTPTMNVRKFVKSCMDSIDNACLRLCAKGCSVDERDELQSSYSHPSAKDMEASFAVRGGFYDGTFALDDEDLWDVESLLSEKIPVNMDENTDADEIPEASRDDPSAVKPLSKYALSETESWWSCQNFSRQWQAGP
jgi:hypothetical protein